LVWLVVALGPVPASAQEAPPPEPLPDVSWRDTEWHAFDELDWLIVGAAVSSVIVGTAVGPDIDAPRQGPVLFDDAVRDALVLGTEPAREIARDASDIFLTTAWAMPVLIDAFLVAGWYHDAPDLAREMLLMNVEVLTVTAALQTIANVVASRERPYGPRCGLELEEGWRACDSNDRYRSFFSGHTSQAFASAAVTCVHHAQVPLYGGGLADAAPCVGTMMVAAAAGALRIVGDQHYATDVLTGALVGTGTGLLLPYLLHYGRSPAPAPEEEPADFSAHLFPTPTGLGVVGTF
jgi:membrane-associated phospholipid phosphatase